MTPKDFVTWLRGFAQAANNFNLTPKQWDDVKEMLATVEDQELGDWQMNHTGGPVNITYETKNEKQLLKTEPKY